MRVEEDLSRVDGPVRVGGVLFTRTAERITGPAFRGHTLASVLGSDHDLLGGELLAHGEPDPSEVAAALAPIVRMDVHTWVGTGATPDKVGFDAGGRTANFDPASIVPEIRAVRAAGRTLCGLVGGELPVPRFVYPHGTDRWTELIAFAPERLDNGNPRVQPVCYRVAQVDSGRLVGEYFAGFPGFWEHLLELREACLARLGGAPDVRIPDQRLVAMTRHSLLRAAATRIDGFPKYGVLDRMYGGSEHDGFPDTTTTEVAAATAWGLFDQARGALDVYLRYFVRPDASLVYRGPETGQYGRLLTVAADYARTSGDVRLMEDHQDKLRAVAELLMARHRRALGRDPGDPAYGIIEGPCEADSAIEDDPARYHLPYLSNSAEAARGLHELGTLWTDADMLAAAGSVRYTLTVAVGRSVLPGPVLPVVAGAALPPHRATQQDVHDPQARAYRSYGELLHSGVLDKATVDTIVDYRSTHRDVVAGVPTMYGWNSGELGGFLAYGHGYGLLQHGRVPEFQLLLHSLAAHHYTRGTWTAPESRRIDAADMSAPYCVPAQLTVPLLLRWALVFEPPFGDELWLLPGAPRTWYEHGIEVTGVPTRWGRASLRVDGRRVEVDVPVRSRLRLPTGTVTVPPGRTELT